MIATAMIANKTDGDSSSLGGCNADGEIDGGDEIDIALIRSRVARREFLSKHEV
jgi:hypothetical protein